MKLFIVWIFLITLWLSSENAPQENNGFNIKIQLQNKLEDRNVQLVENDELQNFMLKIEKTTSSEEANIVVDFKNNYSIAADKSKTYCIFSKIVHSLDYKTEIASLTSMRSNVIMDSAVCEYEVVDKSLLYQFGETAKDFCSSIETQLLVELQDCEIISTNDQSIQFSPLKVLAKADKNCKLITYICNDFHECGLVCVNHAVGSKFLFEETFTIGTETGEPGMIKGGEEESGVYASVQMGGPSIGLYLGTTYLDIQAGISISVSILDAECAVTELPGDTTFLKLLQDFSKDTSHIAPVVQCHVDHISSSGNFMNSAILNVACQGLNQVHIHDCNRICKKELSQEFTCRFASLMYVEGNASLYCVRK